VRGRAEADALHVPGLHALLQSERPGEPVDVSPVALTLAPVEVPPLVQWVADRAFERCDRLRVYPDDTVTVIERDPPVPPRVFDDEDEW
jgi:hypothetical protein